MTDTPEYTPPKVWTWTKPIAGVESVLVPGDPERKTRAERTKNGVPIPDDTWAAIVNTAREVGVSEASIQRAAS